MTALFNMLVGYPNVSAAKKPDAAVNQVVSNALPKPKPVDIDANMKLFRARVERVKRNKHSLAVMRIEELIRD